jgi:hypothetical protein
MRVTERGRVLQMNGWGREWGFSWEYLFQFELTCGSHPLKWQTTHYPFFCWCSVFIGWSGNTAGYLVVFILCWIGWVTEPRMLMIIVLLPYVFLRCDWCWWGQQDELQSRSRFSSSLPGVSTEVGNPPCVMRHGFP